MAFRGIITTGQSDIFRDAISGGKRGGKKQQSQSVVVTDYGFRSSCGSEEGKSLLYGTEIIITAVNIILSRCFPGVFQSFFIIVFP